MENQPNKRIILGIDASTSCLGTSIAFYENGVLDIKYVNYCKMKVPKKINGTEALFWKSKLFKDEFISKYKNIGFTDVIIEEPLVSSPKNTNTVATLLRFNGMISQSIYEALGVIPQYISSYDARKYAFPELMAVRKFTKKGELQAKTHIKHSLKHNELVLFGSYPFDCAKKNILWNMVAERYPQLSWQYNKKDELKVENFDASDSLICILGFIGKEKYKDSEPKISNYTYLEDDNTFQAKYTVEFCDQVFEKSIDCGEISRLNENGVVVEEKSEYICEE